MSAQAKKTVYSENYVKYVIAFLGKNNFLNVKVTRCLLLLLCYKRMIKILAQQIHKNVKGYNDAIWAYQDGEDFWLMTQCNLLSAYECVMDAPSASTFRADGESRFSEGLVASAKLTLEMTVNQSSNYKSAGRSFVS
jgi:hypothetical protein